MRRITTGPFICYCWLSAKFHGYETYIVPNIAISIFTFGFYSAPKPCFMLSKPL